LNSFHGFSSHTVDLKCFKASADRIFTYAARAVPDQEKLLRGVWSGRERVAYKQADK
jgi:hypothetical protein